MTPTERQAIVDALHVLETCSRTLGGELTFPVVAFEAGLQDAIGRLQALLQGPVTDEVEACAQIADEYAGWSRDCRTVAMRIRSRRS